MFERLAVIGVGLIGGSAARSARASGVCTEIVGYDTDAGNLRAALDLGVLDGSGADIAGTVEGADLVLIATPVGAMQSVLASLKGCWNPQTAYTDAGSTKHSVVEMVRQVFGQMPGNFIPGHPIAGAEASGVAAARPDLYRNCRVILTPVAETDPAKLSRVRDFWQALGARVEELEPLHHDRVLAATSHLPHVIAFALVDLLGRRDETEEIFRYAASGFRDFTRIASSDPVMWRDICAANRAEIHMVLCQFVNELQQIATLLDQDRSDLLLELYARAKEARQRFLKLAEG